MLRQATVPRVLLAQDQAARLGSAGLVVGSRKVAVKREGPRAAGHRVDGLAEWVSVSLA